MSNEPRYDHWNQHPFKVKLSTTQWYQPFVILPARATARQLYEKAKEELSKDLDVDVWKFKLTKGNGAELNDPEKKLSDLGIHHDDTVEVEVIPPDLESLARPIRSSLQELKEIIPATVEDSEHPSPALGVAALPGKRSSEEAAKKPAARPSKRSKANPLPKGQPNRRRTRATQKEEEQPRKIVRDLEAHTERFITTAKAYALALERCTYEEGDFLPWKTQSEEDWEDN
jgi:hypothetical protein